MKPPLKIQNPCPKKWDELTGNATRRHCSECNLHVHNLSAMNRRELKSFLANHSGSCVAYEVGANGDFVSKPSWLAGIFGRTRAIALSVLAMLLPFWFSSCASRGVLGRPGPSGGMHGKNKYPPPMMLGYTCGPEDSSKQTVETPPLK